MKTIEAKAFVMRLAAAFPNWRPSQETVMVWVDRLSPYPMQLIAPAIDWYIGSIPSEFAPTIGQILTRAFDGVTGDLSGEEAWAQYLDYARSVGRYHPSPSGGSIAFQAACRATDYMEVCNGDEHTLMGVRPNFIRAYNRALTEHRGNLILSIAHNEPRALEALRGLVEEMKVKQIDADLDSQDYSDEEPNDDQETEKD